MEPILNTNAFVEGIVDKNKELIDKLDKDPAFMNWYNALQQSETVNQALNDDLFSYLYADEFIPGEQEDADYTYLDNRFQRPISSRMLRNAGKTEGARLIKNRRSLQFTEFGKPSRDPKISGLCIKFEDEDYKPTILEKQTIKEFNYKFVDKFFFAPFNSKANLTKWLCSAYQDWFDLDDITFEIRRSGSGMPLGFHLTDPTIVYHVLPDKKIAYERWDEDVYSKTNKYSRTNDKDNAIKYLIMKDQQRIAALTANRMVKSHFFVSSDFREAYRGFSVVEQGIKMLMNIVNSITYNSSNFSNNRTPMGVFAFSGGQTNRVFIEQFKKLLYSYLSGAANRYRIPVLGLPEKGDAKFIPFNMTSREMEFHLWMTLLMTIFCQLSGTNPEEISMSSHESAMSGKKLFDQAPDGILQVSRDTGLNTFLRYIEQLINETNVLKEMTGLDVKAYFNGLVVEDEKVKAEVLRAKLSTTASVNELIKSEDGEEQRLMYGDINIYDLKGINNPAIFGAVQNKVQQDQQKLAQEQQQEAQQNTQQQQPIQQSTQQTTQTSLDNQQSAQTQPAERQQDTIDQSIINKYGEPNGE